MPYPCFTGYNDPVHRIRRKLQPYPLVNSGPNNANVGHPAGASISYNVRELRWAIAVYFGPTAACVK